MTTHIKSNIKNNIKSNIKSNNANKSINKLVSIQEPKSSAGLDSPAVKKNQPCFEHALFDLPFRSYFLLAPAFAIMSLGLWLAFLNGLFNFNVNGLTPIIWHTHEMIFAFGATIAIAFILTAAQTWTGQRSLHGKPLVLLIILWLASRLAVFINSELSIYLALFLQTLWWLVSLFIYTKLVASSKNSRNYLFVPMIALMAVFNFIIPFADLYGNSALALHLSRSMVLVIVLLMTIVGGRVIPFFTVRGANTKAILTPTWLNTLLMSATILSLVNFTFDYFVNLPIKPAVFMIAASILHFIRLLHWRSFKTISVPLLWSLHSAYLFIPLGLLMLGLSYYQLGIGFSNSLHLITIGAISLMILSMMSRVSLGHTGRELIIKKCISLAFILILLAVFIRSFLPYLVTTTAPILQSFIANPVITSWNISAGLWVTALLLFIVVYFPILTSAKK
jgi:uncharacterized protein involved in response to NO